MIRMIVRCRHATEDLDVWRNSYGAVGCVDDLGGRPGSFLQCEDWRIQTKDLVLQPLSITT
jgi:hypothetical protein